MFDKNGKPIYVDIGTEVNFVATNSGKIYYIQVVLYRIILFLPDI